jgi:hypothetical protein
MPTVYEIPLLPTPQSLTLTLGGVDYRLAVVWRAAPDAGWVMDIANASSGASVLAGVPLVTGADLLGQHAHLGLGAQLWVQTDGDPDAVPTYSNLGTGARLYLVVDA